MMTLPRDPKLSHHKISNRAYFTWKGYRYYCGPWPAGQKQAPLTTISKYADLVRTLRTLEDPSEYAPPPDNPPIAVPDLQITELIDRFLTWAEGFYKTSNEALNLRCALKELNELFGELPVVRFSPKRLKEVRDLMEKQGKTRQGINKRIKLVCRCFRWGVEEEYCPAAIYQALRLVSPLRKGHTNAPESERKTRVPDDLINKTLPHLPPQVAALVEIGRLCGARPSELTKITTGTIDQSDPDCWFYIPRSHKTANRDIQAERTRLIPLGPKCQAILKPWLLPDEPDRFLFRPKDRMEDFRKTKRLNRKTPVQPSQQNRALENPRKAPGDYYTTQSLGRAIRTACLSAGLDVWSPGALRKNAAQDILKTVGFEPARAALGHRDGEVTRLHYITAERSLAREAGIKAG